MKSLKFFLIGFFVSAPLWLGFNFGEAKLESFFIDQFYVPSESFLAQAETALSKSYPPAPHINAKSALAIMISADGQQTILLDQDSIQAQPIASLTKLMTVVIAVEKWPFSTMTEILPASVAQDGNIGNLKAGERIAVSELLKMILVESSNDAADALAMMAGRDNFIGLMNLKADELGLESTNFSNATGLEPENNFSTARDLAILMAFISEKYPLIMQISSQPSITVLGENGLPHHLAISTNELLSDPDSDSLGPFEIVGGKTGYTEEAGGCIVLVLKDRRENVFISVILGASSQESRFSEMEKLIYWIRSQN